MIRQFYNSENTTFTVLQTLEKRYPLRHIHVFEAHICSTLTLQLQVTIVTHSKYPHSPSTLTPAEKKMASDETKSLWLRMK